MMLWCSVILIGGGSSLCRTANANVQNILLLPTLFMFPNFYMRHLFYIYSIGIVGIVFMWFVNGFYQTLCSNLIGDLLVYIRLNLLSMSQINLFRVKYSYCLITIAQSCIMQVV